MSRVYEIAIGEFAVQKSRYLVFVATENDTLTAAIGFYG